MPLFVAPTCVVLHHLANPKMPSPQGSDHYADSYTHISSSAHLIMDVCVVGYRPKSECVVRFVPSLSLYYFFFYSIIIGRGGLAVHFDFAR